MPKLSAQTISGKRPKQPNHCSQGHLAVGSVWCIHNIVSSLVQNNFYVFSHTFSQKNSKDLAFESYTSYSVTVLNSQIGINDKMLRPNNMHIHLHNYLLITLYAPVTTYCINATSVFSAKQFKFN